jgi:hypothetical protein
MMCGFKSRSSRHLFKLVIVKPILSKLKLHTSSRKYASLQTRAGSEDSGRGYLTTQDEGDVRHR